MSEAVGPEVTVIDRFHCIQYDNNLLPVYPSVKIDHKYIVNNK